MLDNFKNIVVVGASGGIGSAFVEHLTNVENVNKIYALSRTSCPITHDKITPISIDIMDENSIKTASEKIETDIDMIIVATGMLTRDPNLPEKSLRDLDMDSMHHCFAVNTFGPALIAKYFLPLIPKDRPSVMACLSARVGSISDNQLGGWYSYRASKAALNMMIKNTAIETARKYKDAIIIGLHPGTVDTGLSKKFQSHINHDIFEPYQAAEYLLDVINTKTPKDSGKCFAWDGTEIEP